MTSATSSIAPDDGDEHVLDRVPCRCGGLADVVIAEDHGVVSVALNCSCGSYAVPGTGESV